MFNVTMNIITVRRQSAGKEGISSSTLQYIHTYVHSKKICSVQITYVSPMYNVTCFYNACARSRLNPIKRQAFLTKRQ